jgi:thiol-disulfide isomerase/thioredoxin
MKPIFLLLLLAAIPARAEIYDIKQLDLSSYHGKVLYLDFWASWCKPCQRSFPWMNQLLVKADFDIYHDPSGRIAEEFKVEGMPTSYLIDASGKVVKKHIGFYTKDIEKYEREIEELL